MKKEVIFLTENSQDNEKQLSFKEQILRDFANSQKEEASSQIEETALSDQENTVLTDKDDSDSHLSDLLHKDASSTILANEEEPKGRKPARVPVEVSYQKESDTTNDEPLAKTATYRRDDLVQQETLSRTAKERQANKKKRQNNVAKRIVWTIVGLLLVSLAVTGVFVYNYIDSALKPVDSKATEYVTIEIPSDSNAKEMITRIF